MRAGTTNLASVVGMGEAIELAVKDMGENAKKSPSSEITLSTEFFRAYLTSA